MKFIVITLTALTLGSSGALAWDGYDYENGSYIGIDRGNHVRPGQEVEFYDYNKGGYRTMDIDSVRQNGSSVVIEGIDRETGVSREFEMNK